MSFLPFEIRETEFTLSDFQFYYERKNGKDALDKLYAKVINSNSLAQLCGLSISQRRSPTVHDFRLLGSNLFLLGSIEKITLASLIALWEWHIKVNRVYNIASKDTVDLICKGIIQQSRLNHL